MTPCQECEMLRIQVAILAGEARAWKAMAARAVAQTDEAMASQARMADMLNRYLGERERHVSSLSGGPERPTFFERKEN